MHEISYSEVVIYILFQRFVHSALDLFSAVAGVCAFLLKCRIDDSHQNTIIQLCVEARPHFAQTSGLTTEPVTALQS